MLVIGLGLSVAIAFWPNPNNTLPISHILNDEEVDISEALNLVVMSHRKDMVQLALTNDTPNKIFYSGYTPSSYSERPEKGSINPLYHVEYKVKGTWTKKNIGFCGTGLAELAVPSGHAGKFEVFGIDANVPTMIGIDYWRRDSSNNLVRGILWTDVDTHASLAE